MSSGLNIISGSEEPINQFKIFPNPTFNGIFNVESKPNSIITIYNSTGKVVYLENSIKSTTTIDLCDHANGMYIVEIINDKEIKKQRINIMK
ncbi:MAG: T9SS type A sorting domain-containing protein [Cyclobacteriaceae bacterium]|nr:T9SS type A sorting domain-containing protein [Cyclobacteriaceae bacterium]